MDVTYQGEWETPFWEGDENKGTMRRMGFEARTRIDRNDFGVSWQDEIPGGGVVVSNRIEIVIDPCPRASPSSDRRDRPGR